MLKMDHNIFIIYTNCKIITANMKLDIKIYWPLIYFSKERTFLRRVLSSYSSDQKHVQQKKIKNKLDFKFKSLCASKNTLENKKATYRRKISACKSCVLGSVSSLYKEWTL